jgi:phage FluMu protein Com
MVLIRCECGQALGKIAGKYEVRCHKCKRITRGDTEKAVKTWPPKLMTR